MIPRDLHKQRAKNGCNLPRGNVPESISNIRFSFSSEIFYIPKKAYNINFCAENGFQLTAIFYGNLFELRVLNSCSLSLRYF